MVVSERSRPMPRGGECGGVGYGGGEGGWHRYGVGREEGGGGVKVKMIRVNEPDRVTYQLFTIWMEPSDSLASDTVWNTTTRLWA